VRAFVAETGNDEVMIEYDSGRISAKMLVALFPARYHVIQLSDQALS
jgi:hypothetical protein